VKLKCDEPLSNFAFKFNLRRYNMASLDDYVVVDPLLEAGKAKFANSKEAKKMTEWGRAARPDMA
jgi:hypothetical protein